jgi:hypothetical protein
MRSFACLKMIAAYALNESYGELDMAHYRHHKRVQRFLNSKSNPQTFELDGGIGCLVVKQTLPIKVENNTDVIDMERSSAGPKSGNGVTASVYSAAIGMSVIDYLTDPKKVESAEWRPLLAQTLTSLGVTSNVDVMTRYEATRNSRVSNDAMTALHHAMYVKRDENSLYSKTIKFSTDSSVTEYTITFNSTSPITPHQNSTASASKKGTTNPDAEPELTEVREFKGEGEVSGPTTEDNPPAGPISRKVPWAHLVIAKNDTTHTASVLFKLAHESASQRIRHWSQHVLIFNQYSSLSTRIIPMEIERVQAAPAPPSQALRTFIDDHNSTLTALSGTNPTLLYLKGRCPSVRYIPHTDTKGTNELDEDSYATHVSTLQLSIRKLHFTYAYLKAVAAVLTKELNTANCPSHEICVNAWHSAFARASIQDPAIAKHPLGSIITRIVAAASIVNKLFTEHIEAMRHRRPLLLHR